MKSTICNKVIVAVIAALIIGLTFIPTSVSQIEGATKNNITNNRGPLTSGVIKINCNTSELSGLIPPLSGYKLVHINVSYLVTGLYANIIVPFITKIWSHMPIGLSIEDVPEGVHVFIVPDIVYPEIDTQWRADEALLFISVLNTTTPAHAEYFKIRIRLEPQYESLRGPLGIITWIHTPTYIAEFTIASEYYPLITVTPKNYSIATPPGQVVELPITIKNLGNAKTVVTIDKLEYPDNWGVNIISNTVLNINQERQVSLVLRSPQNFSGNQTIRLAFTPSYFGDPENRGVTEFISILAYYQP